MINFSPMIVYLFSPTIVKKIEWRRSKFKLIFFFFFLTIKGLAGNKEFCPPGKKKKKRVHCLLCKELY